MTLFSHPLFTLTILKMSVVCLLVGPFARCTDLPGDGDVGLAYYDIDVFL